MGSKRLTPMRVGKMASKCLLLLRLAGPSWVLKPKPVGPGGDIL